MINTILTCIVLVTGGKLLEMLKQFLPVAYMVMGNHLIFISKE